MVYAAMSPPLNGPVEQYKGIILANRLLKSEAEGEIVRNMCSFLDAVTKAWSEEHGFSLRMNTPANITDIENITLAIPSLRINMPTSIADIRNITIAIPKSITRSVCNLPESLIPLFDLHISSVKIVFYEDELTGPMAGDFVYFSIGVDFFRFEIDTHIALRYGTGTRHQSLNINKLTVEWGELPERKHEFLGKLATEGHQNYYEDRARADFEMKTFMSAGDECIGATWVKNREASERS